MIDNLKQDDKIVVTKLFTLADSTRHLVELLQVIDNKGAYIYFVQEDIDTSHANGYHFGDIIKHLVDFQSDVISEKRTNEERLVCMKGNKRELQQDAQENLMRM
jgi:DNA invertase Pin-like site-specific DNA recombinase